MSETKWTPGPWEIYTGGNFVHIGQPGYPSQEHLGKPLGVATVLVPYPTSDEAMNSATADGHLIAAAPDLYAALAEFERVFQSNGPIEMGGGLPVHMGISKAVSMAIAALAKARGEA